MWAIHKQELQIVDEQNIVIGAESELLSVDVQRDKLCVWYTVDLDDAYTQRRKIYVRGTGHVLEDGDAVYLGTVLMMNGDLVFHVFDGGGEAL